MSEGAATIVCRRAEFTVAWGVPGASFSMGYATRQRAEEAYANLCASLSVRWAELYRGAESLRLHAYDPYKMHDTRALTGQ